MSETVPVAAITASGSVAVAGTALILNFRLFGSLERRIEVIESDLKNFYRDLAEREQMTDERDTSHHRAGSRLWKSGVRSQKSEFSLGYR
jgi:hypothetical protein